MKPEPAAELQAASAPSASLQMGLIGNCAYSALVDAVGRIVWCCLPRFDGDPVFDALLDAGPSRSVRRARRVCAARR